jgi:hypothetical protein
VSEGGAIDDLYGLPLDRFVAERTALARELRGAGRREEAGEVAALRKPSVAAWAVNQLVRTQGRAVDQLFEAGDELREAQDGVLAGRGDAGSLRDAVARKRVAVDELTQTARGLLTSQGHELSPTIVDRVSDTLHAAALDDGARVQVRDGRLERELRHVGLGMAETAPAPARRRASPKAPAAGRKPSKDEAAVRAAAAERATARAAARAAEREARRRAERATRGAEVARERRDRAAEVLEAAEQALADADNEQAEAEAHLEDAERAVQDLA